MMRGGMAILTHDAAKVQPVLPIILTPSLPTVEDAMVFKAQAGVRRALNPESYLY